jgi:hypothetical protein
MFHVLKQLTGHPAFGAGGQAACAADTSPASGTGAVNLAYDDGRMDLPLGLNATSAA